MTQTPTPDPLRNLLDHTGEIAEGTEDELLGSVVDAIRRIKGSGVAYTSDGREMGQADLPKLRFLARRLARRMRYHR